MTSVFVVAVGLAEARHEKATWVDGLFAAAATWGGVGLAQQARDLRRRFRGVQSLTAAQVWGVRFAVFWRVGVVAILVGSLVLNQMELAGLVSLAPRADDFHNTGQLLRGAAFFLLLWATTAPAGIPKVPRRAGARFLNAAAVLAGSILALVVWCDNMLIWFLVHIACEGIGGLTPARFLEPRIVPSLWWRSGPFFYASLAATLLSALNFTLVSHFPRFSRSGLRLRVALFALLLAATYSLAVWLATDGLQKASPYLHSGRASHPPHVWALALLVIGLSTAYLSLRWCSVPWSDCDTLNNDWRHGRRYAHEGLLWRLLLATAAGGSICHTAAVMYQWSFGGGWLANTLIELVTTPRSLLMLELWIVAFGSILAWLGGRAALPLRGIAGLDAKKFALAWCALMLGAPAAIIALAALSFALWLTPWYNLPLLETR